MTASGPPRRKSLRLPAFDYSTPGGYFITICTWKHALLFSHTAERTALENAWDNLTTIFGGIELDEHVIMPNHFHGIVWIVDDGAYRLHPGTWNQTINRRGGQLPAPMAQSMNNVALGNIVGAFKTRAASQINRLRNQPGTPVWQRNYFEHIIRNERQADIIREYIRLNPDSWKTDRDNPENELFDSPARSMDDYLADFHLE